MERKKHIKGAVSFALALGISGCLASSDSLDIQAEQSSKDSDTPLIAAPALATDIAPLPTFIPKPTLVEEESTPDSPRSPFTGEPVSEEVLSRRPLAVKISNSPEARPQSGLGMADVVFEHLTEGNITRFTALFHSNEVPLIGSIRSCRLIDLEIPAIFDSILSCSGASEGVTQALNNSDITSQTFTDWRGDQVFRRISLPVASEHTLFTDTQTLWEESQNRNLDRPTSFTGWEFKNNIPKGGIPTNEISINYSESFANVFYKYNPEANSYLRWIGDEPHLEALTTNQIEVDNVVVLYAQHTLTDIIEDGSGAKSLDIDLNGKGKAILFRNGEQFEVTWVRENRNSPLLLVDRSDNPIPFKPGNVWFQVVPLNFEVKTS